MSKKQKLELTWIGKDERPKLEPRILIEDPNLSYCGTEQKPGGIFDNMLIKGDNLLALKALEHEYAGKVKCIYIDPPFNTQQAFENYDDGVEHSIWLSLLSQRLELLHKLLSDDGTLFIHIDDNELAYLIAIADEIFGRKKRRYIVTFKQGAPTGHKAINPGCVSTTNFVLIYAKDSEKWTPNKVFTGRERDKRYTQYISNIDAPYQEWEFIGLVEAYAQKAEMTTKVARAHIKKAPAALDDFVMANARCVVRLARPDYDNVGEDIRALIDESERRAGTVLHLPREKHSDVYVVDGERILFYVDKLKEVDGQVVSGEPLTTLWDDLLSNNLHNEGGVSFPKGKKPEALIKRCLDLSTKPGDVVLDSFAGSGTTGAVAHKMGRRWIMVELGDHAETHVLPRMKAVIDNVDFSGVTSAANWRGGGGFRYYTLAPSLLEKDKYDNWVISKKYDANMLAAAVCKLMGFTYGPSQDEREYWRHGHSTETDFIYVTTQSLTYDALKRLSEDVGRKRTLLVCCKAYNAKEDAFDNITLRKIPQVVLKKCEWGRDDYSLKIAKVAPPEEGAETVPPEPDAEAAQTATPKKRTRKPRKKPDADTTPDMFAKRVGA